MGRAYLETRTMTHTANTAPVFPTAAYLASVEESARTIADAAQRTRDAKAAADLKPCAFDTDAAFKSAVFRFCPNVAVRKDLEYNAWQVQYIGTADRANWLHGQTCEFDCGHTTSDQKAARHDAFICACHYQMQHDADRMKRAQEFVAQVTADLAKLTA